MNVIYFTGNVGRDPELRSVRDDKVCNFSVAVKQGYGNDAPTEWYRVEIWGKRGESLSRNIVKGAKVAVCGELVIDEYEGKPQYRVRAYEVDPFCGGGRPVDGRGERKQSYGSERRGGGGYVDPFDADLDDNVPFASSAGIW